MTRAEKIRSMTDEELAKSIENQREFLPCCMCVYDRRRCEDCTDGIKKWLEEEAE